MYGIGGGLLFFIVGCIELIKNYKVLHNKAYIIVDGIVKFQYRPGRGYAPYVIFMYNQGQISRDINTTIIKGSRDRIRVYFNPNSNDRVLRVVERMGNFKYIFMILASLLFFGFAFVIAFPDLII